MPVNVTENIMILEMNESKLANAIKDAVSDVLVAFRKVFLPDLREIPAAGCFIEAGNLPKKERETYRARVRICQVLGHYLEQELSSAFLFALERYLRCSHGEANTPFIHDPAVAESARLARGTTAYDRMRVPAKMILVRLVVKREILLPLFATPSLMPERFGEGNEAFLDLLHPVLRELVLTVKPLPSLKTSLNWRLTAGGKATGKATDVGGDYVDWIPGKAPEILASLAISVGAATSWHDIADVTQEELEIAYTRALRVRCGHRAIKLYLHCLYLSKQSNMSLETFFTAVHSIPHYRIYTEEFKIWTKRVATIQHKKVVRSRAPRNAHNILAARLREICGRYLEGKDDDEGMVAAMRGVSNRRLILEIDEFPQHGPLPANCGFAWQANMAQWRCAFDLFKDYKGYESESSSLAPFTSFFLYLGVYLPAWCLRNPCSGIAFPTNITDFTGAVFVHRPSTIPLPNVENPPLTFRRFNEVINDGNKKETGARCVRVLRDFFEEIISGAELLGLPPNLANPVKDSAVPAGDGRPYGSTKANIPVPVVFLILLYCYRLLDCMLKINDALANADNLLRSKPLFRFVSNKFHQIETTNTLRNLKDLGGFDLDTCVTFNGTTVNFDIVPKRLFGLRKFPIKNLGKIYLLDTAPLEQIIIMFETGLRGQSVQWLDIDFDQMIADQTVEDQGIYPMRVNTDKVKNCAWPAYVAGRVINLLRARRDFRATLDNTVFDEDVYYEGNPESKWGKFKPVFSTNVDNGFPHCDSSYSDDFKHILHGLQRYIDELNLNFIASVPDETGASFKVDATPHSARKNVIRQHLTYLPAEYVGKYITGQTPATVAYYAALNPDSFDKVENHQQAYMMMDGARRAVDMSRGPEVTEPHKPSSALAKAFAANIKQAMHDFGPMSTTILEDGTGSDIVSEGRHQKLTFHPTHICPFGSECPPERKKQGLVRRCNFCDFALRTVDHLPAITSEMRNLSEECQGIDLRLDRAGKSMSTAQRGVLELRRRAISEDLFALMIAQYVLHESLKHLKERYRQNPGYFCFTPEIIVKNLEAVSFPRRDEGLKYVLSRLKEAKTYVSLNDGTIKANIAKFGRRFMSKSDELAELFIDEDLDQTAAEVYSFVHNYLSAHNLTLDDMVVQLKQSVTSIAGNAVADDVLHIGVKSLVIEATTGISL